MCLSVFLATTAVAPTVPFAGDRPVFHAEPIAGDYERVRAQFSMPHVMYLGAHGDCGCGFLPEGDEPDCEDIAAASRAALSAYVHQATATDGGEMFICWEGAFADTARRRLSISAPMLATRVDWLEELTFVEILVAAS